MNKFIKLDIDFNWKNLFARLDSEHLICLNKGDSEVIIGWGMIDHLNVSKGHYNSALVNAFFVKHKYNYVFSQLSYDIKNNETRENIGNKFTSGTQDCLLIVPLVTLILKGNDWLYFGEMSKLEIEKEIELQLSKKKNHGISDSIKLRAETSKEKYIKNVRHIKSQIQKGIIYEMNYCVNFISEYENINHKAIYLKLLNQANAPFSGYFQYNNQVIISASPERFLTKKALNLKSQPIKGTAKRGLTVAQDEKIQNDLINDQKEIAENVMIVDLVRNDLSKLATKNTVEVEELCKLYTFNAVHQLISTVTCKTNSDVAFSEIIQATFPMGSMTGAPKISAMHNINALETFDRGVYSGSIGYHEPNGNFDYNVVIRTLVMDIKTKRISCSVGGAITIKSEPESEYEECLLKLTGLQNALC